MIPHTSELFLSCASRKAQRAFLHSWLKSSCVFGEEHRDLDKKTFIPLQHSPQDSPLLPSRMLCSQLCSKGGLHKHFEASCSICHSFTREKAGQCSLRAGTDTILCFFRNKQEIRKALALNGLVLTSNWNTTVNKLWILSSVFLGSCYYTAVANSLIS